MSFHKKVKFPFEVTKGKAKDLYKLRFIRKSELEPTVQHSMRYTVTSMGKQLDLWFKEQSFTIGALNKEQEKVFQSRKRLRKELRRIKRNEYARHQENIRNKLQSLRWKMIAMKVVQRFKDNVQKNKTERMKQNVNKGKVDFMRVAGNEEFLYGNEPDLESKASIESRERKERKRKRKNEHKNDLKTVGKAKSETLSATTTFNAVNEETSEKSKQLITAKSNEQEHSAPVQPQNAYGHHGNQDPYCVGQRHPSAHGPRMETIPEESVEEVDVEVEDHRAEASRRLTQRNLSLLARSQSKKDVFDDNNGVPLLPDITRQATSSKGVTEKHVVRELPKAPESSGRHRELSVPQMGPTRDIATDLNQDTFDKETQTSFESNPRKSRASVGTQADERKKVVVKVPLPFPSESQQNKIPSAKASSREFGSYYGDNDKLSYSNLGNTLGSDSESELCLSDTDTWERSSDDSRDDLFPHKDTGMVSLTLSEYKGNCKDRNHDGGHVIKTRCFNFPDEANLSSVSKVHKQNPYSLQYKERSFFLRTPSPDKRVHSARAMGSRGSRRESESRASFRPVQPEMKTLSLEDIKGKRLEDIRKEMTKNDVVINSSESATMAVFGKKAKNNEKERTNTPPNTPDVTRSCPNLKPKRMHRTHLEEVLERQRREREEERLRMHEAINSEPVQKYERTKSGRLIPVGTPRISRHEIPSMKDQYYRDKLLKAERDTMLSQNLKMKRFIDTFSKECDFTKLPPIARNTPSSPVSNATHAPKASFGNLVFKVYESEPPVVVQKKVVPSIGTTSFQLLKNCRYLREYTPASDREEELPFIEKESSWKMKTEPVFTGFRYRPSFGLEF